MKRISIFSLIVLPVLALAQFPAPDSFQVDVRYIIMDTWDLCDGQPLQGPAYCNHFQWQAPDPANTPATLTGYRIYKDDEFFLATVNANADTSGGYMHTTFYVTAVYENPAGESGPSNSVYIGDLPVGTDDALSQEPIGIWFDPVHQALRVRGAERVRALWVYDGQGKLVLFSSTVPANQRLEGLLGSIYSIVIQDKLGGMHSKRVAIGF